MQIDHLSLVASMLYRVTVTSYCGSFDCTNALLNPNKKVDFAAVNSDANLAIHCIRVCLNMADSPPAR